MADMAGRKRESLSRWLLGRCPEGVAGDLEGDGDDGEVEGGRSWRWEAVGARQSRKPGETGRPAESTTRRSGGKEKPNSASARADSEPKRSRRTGIEVAEVGDDFVAAAEAALAERWRRPATWAGVREMMAVGGSKRRSAIGDATAVAVLVSDG
ncbi:hypothetical protein Syun_024983 [Stephania yunnanensis]|uniref:Uncharacterized protein n=1 Tax=Stephania yunnanensis TaxID=152371 RepID=A0AAP0EWE2_9MAGN